MIISTKNCRCLSILILSITTRINIMVWPQIVHVSTEINPNSWSFNHKSLKNVLSQLSVFVSTTKCLPLRIIGRYCYLSNYLNTKEEPSEICLRRKFIIFRHRVWLPTELSRIWTLVKQTSHEFLWLASTVL